MSKTFDFLPKEILTYIFTGLAIHDLYECQKVCRLWQLPSELALLKDVHLLNRYDVNQFLRCMEYKPRYQFVQSLTLGDREYKRSVISSEPAVIARLLQSLPSLKKLSILDPATYQVIYDNKELCRSLAIEYFHVSPYLLFTEDKKIMYLKFIVRFKETLKNVEFFSFDGEMDFVKYVAGFPHLTKVSAQSVIRALHEWIPLFEQHPGLETFSCISDGREAIETATPLHIKNLTLYVLDRITTNTAQFISLSMTGLRCLRLVFCDTQQSKLCNDVLDLMNQIDECHFSALFSTETSVMESYRAAFQIFFSNNTAKKTFHFFNTPLKKKHKYRLKVDLTRSNKLIQLDSCGFPINTDLIPAPNVVERLIFEEHHDAEIQSTRMYLSQIQRWIGTLPSIKKLVFVLPVHIDSSDNDLFLMMNSTKEKRNGVLGECISSVPGLMYLTLRYFCGIWGNDSFTLDLDKAKLERLDIDVTPVRVASGEVIEKYTYLAEAYFILEVRRRGRKSLFRVSFVDLSVTEITMDDMRGTKRGEDYVRLLINIAELEYLDLRMYRTIVEGGNHVDYFNEYSNDIINTKITFDDDFQ